VPVNDDSNIIYVVIVLIPHKMHPLWSPEPGTRVSPMLAEILVGHDEWEEENEETAGEDETESARNGAEEITHE
jgi:hypothetical protein